MVNVTEKNMPEKIVCQAKAFPDAWYSWAKEDDPNNTLSKTNSLSLNVPINRKHAGNYICTATNRHGSNTIKTMLNVLCKSIPISLFSTTFCIIYTTYFIHAISVLLPTVPIKKTKIYFLSSFRYYLCLF